MWYILCKRLQDRHINSWVAHCIVELCLWNYPVGACWCNNWWDKIFKVCIWSFMINIDSLYDRTTDIWYCWGYWWWHNCSWMGKTPPFWFGVPICASPSWDISETKEEGTWIATMDELSTTKEWCHNLIKWEVSVCALLRWQIPNYAYYYYPYPIGGLNSEIHHNNTGHYY